MIGYYGYTMLLTYLNAASGMAGIYFALGGSIDIAFVCLLCSGVFDAFDGIVARTKRNRTYREKNYGIQIDSLADTVSFGMLPVMIAFSMGMHELWHLGVMLAYMLAVLIRLAFFNVTEFELQRDGIKRTHYTGLPVTCASIILPLEYFFIKPGQLPLAYIISLAVMAALYLIKIKVPKAKYDESFMKFLYKTALGRTILKLLVKVFVSRFVGWFLGSRFSTVFIDGFISRNNISLNEFKDAEYNSFNAFFTREVKEGYRPFPKNILDLPAPCDGKLTVYHITEDSLFLVKRSKYDVKGLLQDDELASEFMGGTCVIFRLTPDDYHRFSFIDNGRILSYKKIKGVLHTVRPIAITNERYKVYTQNAREYTVIETENFGKVVQVEVGAMFVGKIVNHKTEGAFTRGEEKGLFEFGGSTVMLLFKKDAVVIDEILYKDTTSDIETVVRLGSAIGVSTKQP